MEGVLNEIFSMYEIFLLVFVRTSGIFIFSPLFSSQNVLNIAKIGFTFALSILITLSFPGGIDLSGEILFIFCSGTGIILMMLLSGLSTPSTCGNLLILLPLFDLLLPLAFTLLQARLTLFLTFFKRSFTLSNLFLSLPLSLLK